MQPENNEKHEYEIEIIKLYHEDFLYKHANYWNLVFKSITAVLGLMTLPYFVYLSVPNFILFIFPLFGAFLSIWSLILVESEVIRMSASKKRLHILLHDLPEKFKEIRFDDMFKEEHDNFKEKKEDKISLFLMYKNNKISWYGNLLKKRITKRIANIYLLLFLISLIISILIFFQIIDFSIQNILSQELA